MSLLNRRNLVLGLTGAVGLSAWKGKEMIAPVLDAFAQGSNSSPDRPERLETSRVLPAPGYVTGVTWSQDGSRLAAISDYGRWVTVWQADGTRLVEMPRHHRYLGNSIAFLSNDIVLTPASQSDDESLAFTLWSVSSAKILRNVDGPEPGRQAGYNAADKFVLSPDGKLVAAMTSPTGDPIILYSTLDWSQLRRIANNPPPAFEGARAFAFSPDSATLAIGSFAGGRITGKVKLFDLKNPDAIPRAIDVYSTGRSVGVDAVCFSPDGQFLATGASDAMTAGPDFAPIEVRRLSDGVVVASYFAGDNPRGVRQLSWAPDGRYFTATMGDDVQLFAPNVPEHAIATSAHHRWVTSVGFSPDGHFVAAATDGAVIIFALQP
jgi:WD40 repeat protein